MPSKRQLFRIGLKTAVGSGLDMFYYKRSFNAMEAGKLAGAFAGSEYFVKQFVSPFMSNLGLSEMNMEIATNLISSIAVSYGIDMLMGEKEPIVEKLVRYGSAELGSAFLERSMPKLLGDM